VLEGRSSHFLAYDIPLGVAVVHHAHATLL
jgi:hypothetical protein